MCTSSSSGQQAVPQRRIDLAGPAAAARRSQYCGPRRLPRAQAEQVQRRRPARAPGHRSRPPRRAARCRPGPRSTATGTPSALPFTSSLAAAISSAMAGSVTASTLPWLSVVPRRSSITGQAGGADGQVDLAVAPGSSERVRDDHARRSRRTGPSRPLRSARADASGSTGSSRTVPGAVFEVSVPGGGQHQAVPRLHDPGVAALRDDPDQFGVDRLVRGVPVVSRPSALLTIFDVTETTSPSRRSAASPISAGQVGRRRRSPAGR